jgi:vacuolar-type H+-ATPase subunit D/Vma8
VSNEKPWIYIASPYTRGDVAINVRAQMEAFDAILAMGAVPIAPLFTHFQHMFKPRPYEDWIELDLEIVKRCDACIRLEAVAERSDGTVYRQYKSSGADGEVMAFARMAKPVFLSMHALEAWIDGQMFLKTVSASSPVSHENKGGEMPDNIEAVTGTGAEQVCRPENDSVKGTSAPVTLTPPATGLRTERVVLEVTHSMLGPINWSRMITVTTSKPGESVRVVPEADASEVHRLARDAEEFRQQVETASGMAATAERERDALAARVAAMEAENRELRKAMEKVSADAYDVSAAKIALDGAMARVAELERERDAILRELQDAVRDLRIVRSSLAECEEERDAALDRAIRADASRGQMGMELRSQQKAAAEPVAWGVTRGGTADHLAFTLKDTADTYVRTHGGGTVVPLYSAPPPQAGWLTAKDREWFAYIRENVCISHEADKWIESILARNAPPEVVPPKPWHFNSEDFMDRDDQNNRDAEWIAALAAAGVECKS